MNIIADVAGEYNTLLKLIDKMPPGEFIFLGDLVDRGADSSRVIDYVMRNNYKCVMGNHEHLMLDYLTNGGFYNRDIWFWNGGSATLGSYPDRKVPQEHIDWLSNLPKFLEIDGCLISHAFLRPATIDDRVVLDEVCEFGADISRKGETTIIWNRSEPVRRESWRLQICGHNSHWGLREFRDEQGLYAICLDDSRQKKLTGLHLPTMEIFQEDYVREEVEDITGQKPLWE